MKLFDLKVDSGSNLLPMDGVVHYFGELLTQDRADHYLEVLGNSILWQHDELFMFGRKIITKRKVAWYGDEPYDYTYSKSTKSALPWTPELLELRRIIEQKTGETFNSCLLNLYHEGGEGMGWHSDDEKELKKNGTITSLSMGAERKFVFKHQRTKEKISLNLGHGSLLLMKGATQSHWVHSLPPMKFVKKQRINLTFRTIQTNHMPSL